MTIYNQHQQHRNQQQSNMDEIKRFTVGIMRAANDDANDDLALGTGIILTDDGLIVTCYHIISDIYKKIINNIFYISFPVQPGIRLPALVLDKHCNPSLDVAFLQLQDNKLPRQVTVANLIENAIIGDHRFKSYGYRKQKIFKDGIYSPEGTIEGRVHKDFKDKDIIV